MIFILIVISSEILVYQQQVHKLLLFLLIQLCLRGIYELNFTIELALKEVFLHQFLVFLRGRGQPSMTHFDDLSLIGGLIKSAIRADGLTQEGRGALQVDVCSCVGRVLQCILLHCYNFRSLGGLTVENTGSVV